MSKSSVEKYLDMIGDVYCITYDLNSPGQNYDDLIKSIEGISKISIKYQKSSYLIKTSLLTDSIKQKLNKYIDKNDSLLIIKCANEWEYFGSDKKVKEWLEKHLHKDKEE